MTVEKKELIRTAEAVARNAHEDQFRWDGKTPFITHPEIVAKSFYDFTADIPKDSIPLYIATAWLHDVIEDTPTEWIDLFKAKLPLSVIDAIRAITMRAEETYIDYILRLKENDIAREVKIRDIRHNMTELGDKQKQRKEKYLCALYILESKKC